MEYLPFFSSVLADSNKTVFSMFWKFEYTYKGLIKSAIISLYTGICVYPSSINFKYVDLGGGMGISYNNEKKTLNLDKYSYSINKFLKKNKSKIILEPGRSIIGNTGVLISKVIYNKEGYKKNFIILDAAMNDLMRPALYDAKHQIKPALKNNNYANKVYEFVGPICESTDKFGSYKKFQKLKENDFIVIFDVGAYGVSLSSNYNLRPKPAEILIKKSKASVISKRQKLIEII